MCLCRVAYGADSLSDAEIFIYVSDSKTVAVKATETFRLLLKTGQFLNLKETYIVPSFDGI